MNSIPDHTKGHLPPKKRDPRQGSSEQRPPDEFKLPAPLKGRLGLGLGRQTEGKALSKGQTSNSHYSKDPLLSPPPPAKFHLPCPPAMPYHLFGSSKWREPLSRGVEAGDPTLHPGLWRQGDIHPTLPHPYRSHFVDARDVWGCYGAEKTSYKSMPFARPVQYPEHHHLDGRRVYSIRKPNGIDIMGSSSASRGYSYDQKVRTDSSHTNGKRRYQEEQRFHIKGVQSTSALSTYCSPQGDPTIPSKAPTDKRSYPVPSPLDTYSLEDVPGEAHIYYAVGYPGMLPGPLPQAITPFYSHQMEDPGSALRNSPLSSQLLEPHHLPQVNSHSLERDHSPMAFPRPSSEQYGPRGSPAVGQPPMILPHFAKGSLIELSGGQLRRVEELRTEDFLLCANTNPEFHLSSCVVLLIAPSSVPGFSNLQVQLDDHKTQEILKVLAEYPFFVRDQGWSSCCPQRTTQLYGLRCRQLSVGDVCLVLTPVPSATPPAAPSASRASTAGGEDRSRAPRAPTRSPSGSRTEDRTPKRPPAPICPPPSPATPLAGRKRHCSAPELLETTTAPAVRLRAQQ